MSAHENTKTLHNAEKVPLCKHCGDPIRRINYALGPEWMHVVLDASFPTTGKGTAWKTCRATTVAAPAKGGHG